MPKDPADFSYLKGLKGKDYLIPGSSGTVDLEAMEEEATKRRNAAEEATPPRSPPASTS